ncbi:MAG: hypothetical protein GXY36_13540 [Chloroflexi bacterium]|jgi:hypothetical protein|nr:hypothetical protein [Chloroflexota bacterium]
MFEWLDWLIFLGGIAGFFGTLLGRRAFFDEDRMEMWVTRFGRRNVQIVVAAAYLVFGLIGGYWALS